MKIIKSLPNMTILTSLALLFVCCETETIQTENIDFSVINGVNIKTAIFTETQVAEQQQPNSKNYVMVGDTVIIYRVPKLNKVASTPPDLRNIKSITAANTPVRYVAVGSSLTAGVRDGGYFNEGIQTSYPNLIARQLQIPFNQPYFDDADFNGFGRKIPTNQNPTGGPVQKFNSVKNNTGITSAGTNVLTLKKYSGTALDNFAVPYLGREAMSFYPVNDYLISAERSININGTRLRREALNRILPEKESYYTKIFQNPFDIISMEFRTTEILNFLLGENNVSIGQPVNKSFVAEPIPYSQQLMGITPELKLLRELETKNIKKAILLNVPDFYSLPYFNSISPEMISKANLGNKSIYIENLRLLPTSTIDSLLSPIINISLKKGLSEKNPLTRRDARGYLTSSNVCVCDEFNTEIEMLAKRFNYPIVDIKGLYDKVTKGTYESYKGGKITSKEFFSTDGIYPSALGQACIANEVIKVMNTNYKTTIPLINIQDFK